MRGWVRAGLSALLFPGERVELRAEAVPQTPSFESIEALGLYLHIPFCRQICAYCPYNKILFEPDLAERYADAVCREADRYADLVGGRPVTSFYIGGGTPTTMLHAGLPRILDHIRRRFDLRCGIHMESHINDLSDENLAAIAGLGIEYLSMGVEALQDRHLQVLGRPYTANAARDAVGRAARQGFRCVNADLIFALPYQTHDEVRQAATELIDLGLDQVAAYPLFAFPYTRWPERARERRYPAYGHRHKRGMLRALEETFRDAGFERTSVWAFTRAGVEKYCSVTVPLYLGLGASAASYLRDVFYVNTFNPIAYIEALDAGRLPIALAQPLSRRMQMAGWLYWRVYETRFRKQDFEDRFGEPFDAVYGRHLAFVRRIGMATARDGEIALTDDGAYWLHAVQDLFSLDYVATLWGTAQDEPWPEAVAL